MRLNLQLSERVHGTSSPHPNYSDFETARAEYQVTRTRAAIAIVF